MAHDVFISHAHKDIEIAKAICRKLELARMRCWIAQRDIVAGDDWTVATRKAIGSSRVLLVLLSENANAATHLEREIAQAFYNKLSILPVRLSEAPLKRDFLFYLSDVRSFEASKLSEEQFLDALLTSVRSMVQNSAQASNALPGRALSAHSNLTGFSDSWQGSLQASHYRTLDIVKKVSVTVVVLSAAWVFWYLYTTGKSDGPPADDGRHATGSALVPPPGSTPQAAAAEASPSKPEYTYSRFGLWVASKSTPTPVPQVGTLAAQSTPVVGDSELSGTPNKVEREASAETANSPAHPEASADSKPSVEAVQSILAAKPAPFAESTPLVESTPVAELTPQVEASPTADPQPLAESTPGAESTPVAESSPSADPQPSMEPRPAAESTAVVEASPSAERQPLAESTPGAESTPVAESSPSADPQPSAEPRPAAESTAVVEESPSADPQPLAESTPAAESSPVAEATPFAEASPLVRSTPGQKTMPLAEATPAADTRQLVESMPAAESAPLPQPTASAETRPLSESPAENSASPAGTSPLAGSDLAAQSTPSAESMAVKSVEKRAAEVGDGFKPSSEEQSLKELVLDYLRTVAGDDDFAQERLFGWRVNFYGKGVLPIAGVRASMDRYREEWPVRDWEPEGEPEFPGELHAIHPELFEVLQPFSWKVANGSRRKTGRATLYVRIRRDEKGSLHIIHLELRHPDENSMR
jgi:TIR domain